MISLGILTAILNWNAFSCLTVVDVNSSFGGRLLLLMIEWNYSIKIDLWKFYAKNVILQLLLRQKHRLEIKLLSPLFLSILFITYSLSHWKATWCSLNFPSLFWWVSTYCARMKWSCFSNKMRLSGFLEKEIKFAQIMLEKLQSQEWRVKSNELQVKACIWF